MNDTTDLERAALRCVWRLRLNDDGTIGHAAAVLPMQHGDEVMLVQCDGLHAWRLTEPPTRIRPPRGLTPCDPDGAALDAASDGDQVQWAHATASSWPLRIAHAALTQHHRHQLPARVRAVGSDTIVVDMQTARVQRVVIREHGDRWSWSCDARHGVTDTADAAWHEAHLTARAIAEHRRIIGRMRAESAQWAPRHYRWGDMGRLD